jgi:hypothetical protein
MAVRNDFTAGEVLAAADLNDTFASKLPYSFGTATPTTTDEGFLWYDSTGTPSMATPKFWDGSAFVPFGGKILQIVRATDSTDRSTTSTSFVDVTGMSVTITPQKSDSAVLLILTVLAQSPDGNAFLDFQITDASNNAISGANRGRVYDTNAGSDRISTILIGYSTPATTSPTTYKVRFLVSSGTGVFLNATQTGQLYAIEVSA